MKIKSMKVSTIFVSCGYNKYRRDVKDKPKFGNRQSQIYVGLV